MKIFRVALWILASASTFNAPTAAHAAGSVPRSALPGVESINTVQQIVMPEVDLAGLVADDAAKEKSGAPPPSRFAAPIPVVYSPRSSGTWETLEDGSKLWRLRLLSPGALSLNLGIETFDLPAGATFWVHDIEGAHVQGPYTAKNRNAVGGLWTAVVLGDELVAELLLPAGSNADLVISSVNHGFRVFGEDAARPDEKAGACTVNVACPEGDPWRDQIRSVALISIEGTYVFTGQLINNTAEDDTPYLLTGGFIAIAAPTVVAYWDFQSPTCAGSGGGDLGRNQSGSTLVANSPADSFGIGGENGTDFAVVELDQKPDPAWNLFFVGWDARDQIPSSTTTILHPYGEEKSISFDFDPPTTTAWGIETSSPEGLFWRIAEWDTGTADWHSNGACLYDNSTKRCIGTLSRGEAACGNDDSTWYGRTAKQWLGWWDNEGTRLSVPLDKANTGATFLDGKYADGAVGGTSIWLIPAVASSPGLDPSYWSSRVAVANPTTHDHSISIYFVGKNQPWPGVLVSGPTSLAPNQALDLDDPLAGVSPATGLMYVVVSGSGTAVSARTSTPAAGGGSYGQGQPGILLNATSSASELILPMIDSSPGASRTNVGFAQTSSGAFQVLVQIYSASGAMLAEKTYAQSAAWRQVNDVFGDMGIGGQNVEGGWIRATLVKGSPSYWTAYATVIDASTEDPTYVLPVAR